MQEIEAKRKLRASEGAHFFYTLIFLVATGLIQADYDKSSCSVDLSVLVDLVFYGLTIWATYLLITIIPRYKNPAIKIFFNFLDLLFGIYVFGVFVYSNVLYFDDNNDCEAKAPVLAYFVEVFLIVNYVIFVILGLSVVTWIFRKLSKQNPDDEYDEENDI